MPMSEYARQAHRKADKDRYYWLKEHGICTKCGQNYADAGHVRCVNCRKAYRDWKTRTDPDGSKQRERERARRERLRAEGLCLWCGKNKAIDGQTLCEKCKVKYKDSQIKFKIHKRTRRSGLEWEP